ncbi:hypothetical protein [uncultured Erythrobacter sp.]|uniref:hypothetical protein n=1 Tax=uncultured Erythrobacter sp. TaxID=263913 RepID=UPI00260765ED|nr:hypothetical protein [uncultured Erythrobacter sp.]
MERVISREAILISGPWRPGDNRPIAFLAALFVTFFLFSWILLLNFSASPSVELEDGLMMVEVELQSPQHDSEQAEARKDDQSAGIEAVVTAPAAPLPPAPLPPTRPINPSPPLVFNPSEPLTDLPPLDVGPVDIGRGITNAPSDNRDGGANRQAGTGGGTGGRFGGSGNGDDVRLDLTARWAPSMNKIPFPAEYPRAARSKGIQGFAHLKCFAVRRNRVRKCSILQESPPGYGFGRAALRAQDKYRVIVEDLEGNLVRNEWIIITVEFQPERGRVGAQALTS